MAKSTRVEKEARAMSVMKMLLAGMSRHAIVQNAAKLWGVRPRTADAYIALAKEMIRHRANVDIEYEVGLASARLDDLYNIAYAKGDHWAAFKIATERVRLLLPERANQSLSGKVVLVLRDDNVED